MTWELFLVDQAFATLFVGIVIGAIVGSCVATWWQLRKQKREAQALATWFESKLESLRDEQARADTWAAFEDEIIRQRRAARATAQQGEGRAN